MELGWGNQHTKRILFGVFSDYFEQFAEIHNCKRYYEVSPLYIGKEFPRRRFIYDNQLERVTANICENADSIYFLLDDLRFKLEFNDYGTIRPATLMELHIVLSEQDYINKTTFFKSSHIIEPERVYEWWTNVV